MFHGADPEFWCIYNGRTFFILPLLLFLLFTAHQKVHWSTFLKTNATIKNNAWWSAPKAGTLKGSGAHVRQGRHWSVVRSASAPLCLISNLTDCCGKQLSLEWLEKKQSHPKLEVLNYMASICNNQAGVYAELPSLGHVARARERKRHGIVLQVGARCVPPSINSQGTLLPTAILPT